MSKSFDLEKQPDLYRGKKVKFHNDRLTGGIIAQLPGSVLSLTWYPGTDGGAYVNIGRPFLPGGSLTRVTNYRYEYAENAKKFRALARAFNDEATEKA